MKPKHIEIIYEQLATIASDVMKDVVTAMLAEFNADETEKVLTWRDVSDLAAFVEELERLADKYLRG